MGISQPLENHRTQIIIDIRGRRIAWKDVGINNFLNIFKMKEYKKAKIIAKNLPTGSYAAGCGNYTNKASCLSTSPSKGYCKDCERSN